jgi:drug/metabolite transporter (DMT)-like permease
VDLRSGTPTGLPSAAVAVVAVLWGVTFTVTAEALTVLPPAEVVVLRFGLAAVILAVITRHATPVPEALRRRAVVLGALLGLGFLLQTWALQLTDAVMSGFLTGLLVVIAPVLDAMIFRRRTRWLTWVAVSVALVGLLVLSVRSAGLGLGDGLTIAAAAVWALHLVLLSRWSVPGYAAGLARIQTTTVAVVALVPLLGASWGRSAWTPATPTASTWALIAFLAVLSTALPIVLLTWAQSRVDATRTAVILTLEPAVAAITATVAGAALDPRTIAGGALLLMAMVVVELRSGRAALEPASPVG